MRELRTYVPTASSTTNRLLLTARSRDIFVDRERPIIGALVVKFKDLRRVINREREVPRRWLGAPSADDGFGCEQVEPNVSPNGLEEAWDAQPQSVVLILCWILVWRRGRIPTRGGCWTPLSVQWRAYDCIKRVLSKNGKGRGVVSENDGVGRW